MRGASRFLRSVLYRPQTSHLYKEYGLNSKIGSCYRRCSPQSIISIDFKIGRYHIYTNLRVLQVKQILCDPQHTELRSRIITSIWYPTYDTFSSFITSWSRRILLIEPEIRYSISICGQWDNIKATFKNSILIEAILKS